MQLSDFDQSKCGQFQPDSNFGTCTYYEQALNPFENGYCKRPENYRCVATTTLLIPLSYSSVSDFLTCHHLYYLKAIRGIQTKDAAKSSPLKMGTLWDKVLQKHLGGENIDIPAIINQYEISDMDVAKVKGIFRAYKALEIKTEPGGELQARISMQIDFEKIWTNGDPVKLLLTGFYERKYPGSFVENKLSGKPDFYLDPFFIQSQVGTYFLADPELQACTMEIIRTPQLKQTGKNKDESAEELTERVYQDAISRPSHYFIGWNAERQTYGKKYFRSEFNLDEIKNRYINVFREIFHARIMDGWYKNDRVCQNILPGISCDMLQCCRYNNINEQIYQIREKKVAF
jgi:hypothetical protein